MSWEKREMSDKKRFLDDHKQKGLSLIFFYFYSF